MVGTLPVTRSSRSDGGLDHVGAKVWTFVLALGAASCRSLMRWGSWNLWHLGQALSRSSWPGIHPSLWICCAAAFTYLMLIRRCFRAGSYLIGQGMSPALTAALRRSTSSGR